MKKPIIFVLALLFILPLGLAQNARQYDVTFQAEKNDIKVKVEASIAEGYNGFVDIPMSDDSVNANVLLDGKPVEFAIITRNNTKLANVKLTSLTRSIIVEYNTTSHITKAQNSIFVSKLEMPFDAETVHVRLLLPEYSTLSKNSPDSSSYFPKAYVSTDGQRIMLTWNYNNLVGGDYIEQMAVFKMQPKQVPFVTYSLAALFGLAILTLVYVLARKKGVIIIKRSEVVSNNKVVLPGLKEKEEQVINILRLKEGSTTQATIRVALNMPKATLSAVIKELSDRKIVNTEKKGNKSVITLKEDFMNKTEQETEQKPAEQQQSSEGSGSNP
jgi:uncharacterized membrane protein